MNFNSRETYLVAVANWKANYAQLSHDLRKTKLELRIANSELGVAQRQAVRSNEATMKSFREASRKVDNLHMSVQHMKGLAREALEERAESKVEACRQWNAARTEKLTS